MEFSRYAGYENFGAASSQFEGDVSDIGKLDKSFIIISFTIYLYSSSVICPVCLQGQT